MRYPYRSLVDGRPAPLGGDVVVFTIFSMPGCTDAVKHAREIGNPSRTRQESRLPGIAAAR
ncbi:hypothetical protein ATK36_1375 [Amycolatopsis sulphurea]|uniref:Uncharacterized protein n=1 Tax=Amycolatopsis sulphurea TaxID=76022 RepID=A0A2A9F6L8_9PSEU|nr:hypothetical protein ATK36_1375 [Amycolatopsis sulphurea]